MALPLGCLKASALWGMCFAYMWRRVHWRVRWGLVWVSGMEVGIVGVVMGIVSLRVVVSTLAVALAVVVMAVVLVRVGRGLQVLVRVWVHVMVGALLLPRWHHLHHVAHGVHVAVGDGTRVVWKCSLQPLSRQNGHRTQCFTSFSANILKRKVCTCSHLSVCWLSAVTEQVHVLTRRWWTAP